MSSAIKILPHYTYDDYVQWEGQLDEYVNTAFSGNHIAPHTVEVAAVWALTASLSASFPAISTLPPVFRS